MRILLLLLLLFCGLSLPLGAEEISKLCAICAVTEGAGPEPVKGQQIYKDRTYYFCSEVCQQKFAEDSEKWATEYEKVASLIGAGNFGSLGDWELELNDGSRLRSAELRGKVVIVDFWGTHCGPCVAEIPDFIRLQKEQAGQLQVIGISFDQNEEVHQKFLRDKGVNYPSVRAFTPSGKAFMKEIKKRIGAVKAIPITILIDRRGQIVYREVGPIGDGFRHSLEKALEAK